MSMGLDDWGVGVGGGRQAGASWGGVWAWRRGGWDVVLPRAGHAALGFSKHNDGGVAVNLGFDQTKVSSY